MSQELIKQLEELKKLSDRREETFEDELAQMRHKLNFSRALCCALALPYVFLFLVVLIIYFFY